MRWPLFFVGLIGVVVACRTPGAEPTRSTAGYDPTAVAWARRGAVTNVDAAIPAACYARTDGRANSCWVCHTDGHGRMGFADGELQAGYDFADTARTNRWTNAFIDRRAEIAAIDDDTILDWIRTDNYQALRTAMAALPPSYPGFRPDLDVGAGVDAHGLARDGSGWRAVRYQPFPGATWPSTGSIGDLFVRLPPPFRRDPAGRDSSAVYRLNLALLEAAITAPAPSFAVDRVVEPIDERVAGVDLDGDGAVTDRVTRIRALPARYVGGAADVAITPQLYPAGTEFLHSVRYLDPDAATGMSTRWKELRYARKVEHLDDWGLSRAYAAVADEKSEGHTPRYQGDALAGFHNGFGWQYQAFIEDAGGRLRLQTDEEHRACLGCHGAIGVTIDHGFAFARKVPGADGWRPQDLRGLVDRPQLGHRDGELATYIARAGDAAVADLGVEVHRADRDLAARLLPPRETALALDKAYLAVVREQSFSRGRDAAVRPTARLHASIDEVDTGLAAAGRTYVDGRLLLAW